MRPLQEIIDEYTDDNEVDLKAVAEEAAAEMGGPPTLNGADAIDMLAAHLHFAITYIGGLALQTADELGALPAGFDAAYDDLLFAIEFDKFRHLYNLKEKQTEIKLITPEG
jgi:hypothetical protein